jgi:hypothetical protein
MNNLDISRHSDLALTLTLSLRRARVVVLKELPLPPSFIKRGLAIFSRLSTAAARNNNLYGARRDMHHTLCVRKRIWIPVYTGMTSRHQTT